MSVARLITLTELAQLPDARILDVRWRLDAPDGRDAYATGHIPGAVYVSLEDELAAHGAPTDGRHPLPLPDDLQAAARRWGLDDGDTVVIYDDWNSYAAARAWWLLSDAGVADIRILDGGLSAWRDAGLPLDAGEATPRTGGIRLSSGHLPQLGIEEAERLARSGTLLDVRAGERYRGEVEPIDPRAGHIPGARSLPTAGNVAADGRFLDTEALAARYADIDRSAPVGAYCGSGVTAAHAVFALRLAGIDAALYPGSWSQWANHPEKPVATGAQP